MLKQLQPDPTFACPFDLPIPGKKPHRMEVTFRHRGTDELTELHTKYPGVPTFEYVREIVVGWDLSDQFDEENLRELIRRFPGAAQALMKTYIAELHGLRLGN